MYVSYLETLFEGRFLPDFFLLLLCKSEKKKMGLHPIFCSCFVEVLSGRRSQFSDTCYFFGTRCRKYQVTRDPNSPIL
jgi:hypothetical protein